MTDSQKNLLRILFSPLRKRLRVHDPLDLLEAMGFVITTGCRWRRLPPCYPPASTVYYHFRSWTQTGGLELVLGTLVVMRRHNLGQQCSPTTMILDSQSVRIGLPDSVSGIDGGKRIKGIKRHIGVDKNGYPLGLEVTTANIHDTKGCQRLIPCILSLHRSIRLIKADQGYRGVDRDMPLDELGINLQCVKSNSGTSEFIPIEGRWVVERTFSWLQNYRRLNRNYERFLKTARDMALLACVLFMLRYF